MEEKTETRILIVTFVLAILITFAIGMVIIDFYNDYQCRTTNSIGWYLEHNCERYNK